VCASLSAHPGRALWFSLHRVLGPWDYSHSFFVDAEAGWDLQLWLLFTGLAAPKMTWIHFGTSSQGVLHCGVLSAVGISEPLFYHLKCGVTFGPWRLGVLSCWVKHETRDDPSLK